MAYTNVTGWGYRTRTEDFSVFAMCGGSHIVLNAMHSDRDGAYSAIVTYDGYDVLNRKRGMEKTSLQSELVCVRNNTMMMASAMLLPTWAS